MPRIAVDAMGGDRAPIEIVHGCLAAAERGVDVVIVGDESRIARLVDTAGSGIPIVHASQVVGMDDDPARAIREKKDSSISVAARLVRQGEADGLVSAGSTGATLAAAAFIIGRLDGVSRPAIASVFPTGQILIDAGANLECRPAQLVQFAVMGSAVGAVYHGVDRPRVGLLNIGHEEGKGRDVEKEAYTLLAQADPVNFIGNVEGHDIASEDVDIFVTDGWTGNVLLKTSEGVSQALYRIIMDLVSADEYQEALVTLAKPMFELRHRLDAESVGGAHLVGTNGVVVIAHGSSSRVAITNAIEMAADGVEQGLIGRITDGIATLDGSTTGP